jgi:DNA invertase Pin-like site-specific DNA recombinase
LISWVIRSGQVNLLSHFAEKLRFTCSSGAESNLGIEIVQELSCILRLQKWPSKLESKMSNLVGYARVSTRDQEYDGQLVELEAAGCTRIYREKESGARTDRPELRKAIAKLESGDVLVVTRLDRLARSTRDLLNVLAEIAARGAGFKSLHDTWADTTTPHGRLMLTVLGGLAEFERELIRVRTGAGRERARSRGVKFGRPPRLDEFQRREALARLAAGETQADVARSYRVNPATISRLAASG